MAAGPRRPSKADDQHALSTECTLHLQRAGTVVRYAASSSRGERLLVIVPTTYERIGHCVPAGIYATQRPAKPKDRFRSRSYGVLPLERKRGASPCASPCLSHHRHGPSAAPCHPVSPCEWGTTESCRMQLAERSCTSATQLRSPSHARAILAAPPQRPNEPTRGVCPGARHYRSTAQPTPPTCLLWS